MTAGAGGARPRCVYRLHFREDMLPIENRTTPSRGGRSAALAARACGRRSAWRGQPAPTSTLINRRTFRGYCHADGGRAPARGQSTNTVRSDDFIRNRIKNGKEGAMPAFGKTFSDADIDLIIAHIRALKPE